MNKINQNDLEFLCDQISRGLITSDQANVEMVRMARVKLVTNSIPAQVRKALNAAVKSGELCHIKKDGRKPEAYYHPSFEHLVNAERNNAAERPLEALAGVLVHAIALKKDSAQRK